MTISHLWLPSLGANAPAVVPALEQTNTTTINPAASSPFTVTLPGSYSTKTNDCIIMGMCLGGSNTLTFSGCGATWVDFQEDGSPRLTLAVGYGCTSGGTSVSVTGYSGGVGDIVVSVWSGIKSSSSPVVSTQVGTSGVSNVSNVTSASLTYSAGQLVIGVGGAGGTGFSSGTPPVWGDGATNTNVYVSNSQRATRMDYELPSSNSSTTLEEILSTGTQVMRVIVANLSHA